MKKRPLKVEEYFNDFEISVKGSFEPYIIIKFNGEIIKFRFIYDEKNNCPIVFCEELKKLIHNFGIDFFEYQYKKLTYDTKMRKLILKK